MRKLILKVALLVCLLSNTIVGSSWGQSSQLRFNKTGKFKIVQFTDLHICYQDPRSEVAFSIMNEVLDRENPDLVVFTGDLIYSQPAIANMESIIQLPIERKIPFVVAFGNHDREQGVSNEELLQVINRSHYNLNSTNTSISGVGNTCLPIQSAQSNKEAFALYIFDSHRECELDIKGYDYIKYDQIDWYRKQSEAFAQQQKGEPLPSLFFFHIPLPEYAQAASDENAALYGIRREKVCAPVLNTGLFAAAKEGRDVLGMFVGHDHDNDYAVCWNGILLAYGRFTGGDTEYNHIANGARVIELTEGRKGFTTWIREAGDKTMQYTSFPEDYIK